MKNSIFLVLISFLLIIGCSAVQETDSNDSESSKSVYVFDDVSLKDSTENIAEEISEPNKIIEMYIVQVGDFSTLEKAELFISEVKDKTNFDLNTHLNDSNNLHVIQLPPFRTREEAEETRDKLKTIQEFNGTFIVPNNK
ncbi:MAG: SPOR domain-containing protein [Melioribacteraceae bacterium]|jgi:cell division protein FtsN|nr:SPOR domain-containing protein [Melioribacteraceae bacterium]